jgi:hypothetical protein
MLQSKDFRAFFKASETIGRAAALLPDFVAAAL